MLQLSEEQLNNLNKDALVIIATSLQGQLTLFDSFNEAEGFMNKSVHEPTVDEVAISSYRRSKAKGRRETDLDGLPARIFEHRLSEEELSVKFPGGYKELPVEVYKRLHIILETFIVDEHHVQLGCQQCRALPFPCI